MKIKKYAQASPPAGFGAVTKGPATAPSAGSGTGGAYQKPSSYPSGVYGRPTPEEKEKVILMQQTLSNFAQALINKDEQEKLIKSLGASKEELNKWSQALVSTGGKATFDGKWSTKTSNALKTVNEIIAKATAKKIYSGAAVVDKHNYQVDAAKTIMNDADANVDKITSLASALRVGKYLGKKDEVENAVLDVVPSVLNDENWKRLTGGVRPVRASNLSSLYNFYYFLDYYQLKKASSKEKLKKLAEHIVSTDIIKEAQVSGNINVNVPGLGGDKASVSTKQRGPTQDELGVKVYDPTDRHVGGVDVPKTNYPWPNAPGAHGDKFRKIVEYYPQSTQTTPAAPAQQKPVAQAPGLNINELEAALQWFWQRSNYALFVATNPADKDVQINSAEVSKAQTYVNYVTRLYNQFYSWKAKGEPSIATLPGGPMERGDKGGSYPKPGRGGHGGREGYGLNVGDESDNIAEDLRRPPLRDFINIKELADKYNANISSYSYALKNSWLDIKTLRGSYAPNIYNEMIKKQTHEQYWAPNAQKQGTSVLIYLKQTLYAISGTLGEIFSNWSESVQGSDQPRDVVEQVIRQQKKKLNEWISVIQRVNDDIDNLVSYQRGRFGLK